MTLELCEALPEDPGIKVKGSSLNGPVRCPPAKTACSELVRVRHGAMRSAGPRVCD